MDDTQIYLSVLFAQLQEEIARMAHEVGVIWEYAIGNGLKLNISKSKILILGSNAYVGKIDFSDLPPISINGTNLPYVSDERISGVVMQNNLSWSKHVFLISHKSHGTLHSLKYHKNSLPTETNLKLVTTLVLP